VQSYQTQSSSHYVLFIRLPYHRAEYQYSLPKHRRSPWLAQSAAALVYDQQASPRAPQAHPRPARLHKPCMVEAGTCAIPRGVRV
jgi:hypothetical protein